MITNPHFLKICGLLNASERCVLATVARVQGSGPREEGAWMAVFPSATVNTIGGGHLEFDVIAKARAWLAQAGVGESEQTLPAGSSVLIMSFSHAEDLDVLAACLKRQREQGDLRWLGLIGSKTKWATFRHRLQARGFSEAELAQVTCPIGIAGIAGKQPEVIAISVAAQLLQQPLNE